MSGGRVFVTTRDPERQVGMLYALDRASGSTLWSRNLGPSVGGLPAYDEGAVFVLDGQGLLRRFDAVTGRLDWVTEAGPDREDPTGPVALDARVYVTTSAAKAFDAVTGRQLWSHGSLDRASSPAVGPDTLYSAPECPEVAALSRTDGKPVWTSSKACSGGGVTPVPVLAGSRLYLRDNFSSQVLDAITGAEVARPKMDRPPAFAGDVGVFSQSRTLTARDVSSDAELWTFSGDGGLTTAPLIVGDQVFVGSTSGRLYALDLRTGGVVWSGLLPHGFGHPAENVMASGMAAAEGTLIAPTDDGTITAFTSADAASGVPVSQPAQPALVPAPPLPPSGQSYRIDAGRTGSLSDPAPAPPLRELWSRATDGPTSFPLIADNLVVVIERASSTRWALVARDRTTGDVVWTRNLAGFQNAPLLYGDTIYVLSADGHVQTIDLATGNPGWSVDLDPQGHMGSSDIGTPIATQGKVFMPWNGLFALDPATGETLWHSYYAASQPAADARHIYTASACNSAIAHRLGDGVMEWGEHSCGGSMHRVVAIDGDRVWTRDDGDGTSAGRIRAPDDGRLLDGFGASLPPAFGLGTAIVPTDDSIQAIDRNTGILRWQFDADDHIAAAPVIIGRTVYFGTGSGVMRALDLDTGDVVWRADAGAIIPRSTDYPSGLPIGLGAGDGLLVVPAVGRLVAYTSSLPVFLEAPSNGTTSVDARFVIARDERLMECALDDAGWSACEFPLTLHDLDVREHRLAVRAVNQDGLRTDSVSYAWSVVEPAAAPTPDPVATATPTASPVAQPTATPTPSAVPTTTPSAPPMQPPAGDGPDQPAAVFPTADRVGITAAPSVTLGNIPVAQVSVGWAAAVPLNLRDMRQIARRLRTRLRRRPGPPPAKVETVVGTRGAGTVVVSLWLIRKEEGRASRRRLSRAAQPASPAAVTIRLRLGRVARSQLARSRQQVVLAITAISPEGRRRSRSFTIRRAARRHVARASQAARLREPLSQLRQSEPSAG